MSGIEPRAVERRSGAETFSGKEPGQLPAPTVGEFWAWAFSDLRDNTTRGVLAEFLVGWVLGLRGGIRSSWDDWDLTSPEGIRVEVKASGFLQSWHQKRLSKIGFGRLSGRSWDPKTGNWGDHRRLRADVYVFAVQTCSDPLAYDPLALDQWEFHVLRREALEKAAVRSISLATVESLDAIRCGYEELAETIRRAAGVER